MIETMAAERGIDVPHAGLEKLDALWDEAKRAELSTELSMDPPDRK
jgi:uncharacterized protein YabN with tetrapyrrole methylase and pyrophosphatase domain